MIPLVIIDSIILYWISFELALYICIYVYMYVRMYVCTV